MLFAEQRRWERHPFSEQIRVLHSTAGGETIIHGRGVRLSKGGICLFAAADLPLGTQIQIEFETSPQGRIQIPGKVRNRQVYLYGIEFVADRLEERRSLAWFRTEFCN